ncbi:hypothetical protein [Eubacterium sp. AB3007]|uniref:hypothetical protein n=1 Tax=Eubacterium sp. AB3007 TaxID=1392487 RepID=UPI000489A985|nr:hypothetical protein [Eubacterium sp. AB3007]
MNNAYKVLRILKWACFPLGWIMYMATEGVLGETLQIALATAATVSFWMIVRREETRQMEKSIADVILEAVSGNYHLGNAVEVKRIRSGAVARVYVFGDEERLNPILEGMKRIIGAELSQRGLSSRVWVLQLTAVSGKEEIPARRELLNEVMFKDLEAIQKHRERSGDSDGRE